MFFAAFILHVILSFIVGVALFVLGRRFLSFPYSEFSMIVPLVVALGILLFLATLPFWPNMHL